MLGLFVIAVLSSCISILTRDPCGNLPHLPAGPGLTLDEVYNVEMGVYLTRSARLYGLGLLSWDSLREVFGSPQYNPDHPPLGRLALGIVHDTVQALRGHPPNDYVTADARIAPALAFGCTIFLIGLAASRWCGTRTGLLAAVSLPLIPRLFGHSHLAALETFVGLAYTAVILYVADVWSRSLRESTPGRRPTIPIKYAAIAGVLFGLALLTKIQGALAAVPIGLWGLWHFRQRAILPGAVFGVVGFLTFFLGWPWLWLDPVAHVTDYFARSTDRSTLYCFYQGQKLADRDVPWHYPFVIFATTVPLGLHLAALFGLFATTRLAQRADITLPATSTTSAPSSSTTTTTHNPQPTSSPATHHPPPATRLRLVALAILFPLVLFALPGITVYDGERLFLISYPLWGIFIGKGLDQIWSLLESATTKDAERTILSRRTRFLVAPLMIAFLALQCLGHWTTFPFLLSHYNALVGGLRGANALGFERNYWGEAINRPFLEAVVRHVPHGSTIHVAPVIHPLQLFDLAHQSPLIQSHGLQLVAYDDKFRPEVRYVIVHRRLADPWATLDEDRAANAGFDLLHEVRREGVQLAALYMSSKAPASE